MKKKYGFLFRLLLLVTVFPVVIHIITLARDVNHGSFTEAGDWFYFVIGPLPSIRSLAMTEHSWGYFLSSFLVCCPLVGMFFTYRNRRLYRLLVLFPLIISILLGLVGTLLRGWMFLIPDIIALAMADLLDYQAKAIEHG